jgi:hypothetical protein
MRRPFNFKDITGMPLKCMKPFTGIPQIPETNGLIRRTSQKEVLIKWVEMDGVDLLKVPVDY